MLNCRLRRRGNTSYTITGANWPCRQEVQKIVFCWLYSGNMNYPFFYIPSCDSSQMVFSLDEHTSRHIAQVLRMKEGEILNLTDGKGNLLTCALKENHKKHCLVEKKDLQYSESPLPAVTICISLIKNTSRFEWFLEKATEIGVREIIPLICERTEKEKFRFDRMQQICISAMLQSQQVWLPVLHEPVACKQAIEQSAAKQKFIAHCEISSDKQALSTIKPFNQSTIFIGPEGDFTKEETDLALRKNFIPVSLGNTRLRTETAGVVAATLLRIS